jgi:pilus assembly protein Flp/PilA
MVAAARRPYHRTMMDRVLAATVHLQTRWQSFIQTEKGASMVEYAIMVALIAIVAVVAVTYFGTALSDEYDSIADSVQKAGT